MLVESGETAHRAETLWAGLVAPRASVVCRLTSRRPYTVTRGFAGASAAGACAREASGSDAIAAMQSFFRAAFIRSPPETCTKVSGCRWSVGGPDGGKRYIPHDCHGPAQI